MDGVPVSLRPFSERVRERIFRTIDLFSHRPELGQRNLVFDLSLVPHLPGWWMFVGGSDGLCQAQEEASGSATH